MGRRKYIGISAAFLCSIASWAHPVIVPDGCDLSDPALENIIAVLSYDAAPAGRRVYASEAAGSTEVQPTVGPLLETAWAQRGVPDAEADPYYNYLTPGQYPVGCVVAAVAQIMRYHRYPEKAVPSTAMPCKVDGKAVTISTSGEAYDWDAMDVAPHVSRTDAGRRAVATLMADVGAALKSEYAAAVTEAVVEDFTDPRTKVRYGVKYVLKDFYGYSSCDEASEPSPARMREILKTDLDAGRPVLAAVLSTQYGNHEMVIDGYGYLDGELYHHVNLGIDGNLGANYNIWYKLPDVYVFDQIWHLDYNIAPPSGTPEPPDDDDDGDPDPENPLAPASDGAFSAAAASVYDGFLQKSGEITGVIQVKAGKAAKDGSSKLAIAITPAGGKKFSVTAVLPAGESTVSFDGGSLTLRATGLAGSYNGATIIGVRNRASSKNAAEKAAAAARLASMVATYAVTASDGTAITLTVAKTGKVKVSGTVAGAKDSAAAQLLLGDSASCIPVVMKKSGISFTVWLGDAPAVEGLDGANIGKTGNLSADAVFYVDFGDYTPIADPKTPVTLAANGKWILPKAGKLAFLKGTQELDWSKAGENPCALKLTFKAKDGSFKGSFKLYENANGKLKALKATVAGIVLNGKGAGTVAIKGLGTFDCHVE